ncbi:hypothetical protein MCBMB27_04942 [Methylobacterium phyllosphaerae]|uniref:Uncharacterized protein n=1 Tax=Methylobacterium phyllosphaerae TaxID=418223 RepID=A0AAE8L6Q6_9HYPH|nr:hypothetical protein MCBMB27_04942 [Methylobacterium phyllosphaerae]SFG96108.1 hypothetical protein SAMN05192567_1114 [Methylobacterium phyllosphaerae]
MVARPFGTGSDNRIAFSSAANSVMPFEDAARLARIGQSIGYLERRLP